ncbi:nitrous oxide reductase accessory protein NosL [Paenisporosarcina quisquiliarum]|uniref:Nitrous oxide reductase accessory protein NosL n=1 Tax=Paenisporosarcina quisquiliarum TaxID=365346 RepID=A0A9X3LKQ1_9BACL|nr:nitrous oxide reductase accessory protein NosL [Paenisporosarcina quisquiliarum]MCZ8538344.1 nitrous oxide reductase accessory protein NosL [Paenisporosarcina quisquiliarum]
MKKIQWTSLLILVCLTLAGCGTDEATPKQEEKKVETMETPNNTAAAETIEGLMEPTETTTCAYCQMDVYVEGDELGMFSAQGRTAEGENLFFDDVGCMLNQERMDEIVLEKYVRDYDTNEWVPLEEAVVVKAEIKTPMNYGFAFFKDEDGAQAFINQMGKEKASLSSIAAIDEVSGHRHMKRMEKMQSGKGNGHGEGSHMEMNEGMNDEQGKSEEHSHSHN